MNDYYLIAINGEDFQVINIDINYLTDSDNKILVPHTYLSYIDFATSLVDEESLKKYLYKHDIICDEKTKLLIIHKYTYNKKANLKIYEPIYKNKFSKSFLNNIYLKSLLTKDKVKFTNRSIASIYKTFMMYFDETEFRKFVNSEYSYLNKYSLKNMRESYMFYEERFEENFLKKDVDYLFLRQIIATIQAFKKFRDVKYFEEYEISKDQYFFDNKEKLLQLIRDNKKYNYSQEETKNIDLTKEASEDEMFMLTRISKILKKDYIKNVPNEVKRERKH